MMLVARLMPWQLPSDAQLLTRQPRSLMMWLFQPPPDPQRQGHTAPTGCLPSAGCLLQPQSPQRAHCSATPHKVQVRCTESKQLPGRLLCWQSPQHAQVSAAQSMVQSQKAWNQCCWLLRLGLFVSADARCQKLHGLAACWNRTLCVAVRGMLITLLQTWWASTDKADAQLVVRWAAQHDVRNPGKYFHIAAEGVHFA